MIDVGVVLHVECDAAVIVEPHRKALRRHPVDLAQGPVLDARVPVVAQKHDPVAGSEGSLAPLGVNVEVLSARTRSRSLSLAAALSTRTSSLVRVRISRVASRAFEPFTTPTIDQIGPRRFSRVGSMNHAVAVISLERLARSARGQLASGVALPVFALAPDLGDLDRAMALGQRSERRAGLDRLQLLRIADQHHLGAGRFARR